MVNHTNREILQQIENKLGFTIKEYNSDPICEDVYEKDNIPNPFDKLSLEELLFLRKLRKDSLEG